MAKVTITIEDAIDGSVRAVCDPTLKGMALHAGGRVIPAYEYAKAAVAGIKAFREMTEKAVKPLFTEDEIALRADEKAFDHKKGV